MKAMRLYTMKDSAGSFPAVEKEGRLYRLSDLGYPCRDMNDFIKTVGTARLNEFREAVSALPETEGLPLADAILCSPIETPLQDVICLGVNYDEHIRETVHVADFQDNAATVYFSKRASLISGTGMPIPAYEFVDSLDYEVELAVIIGRDIRDYSRENDPSPIFGYSVFNDVSARNLQFRHKQWYRGKSLDGHTIMGPCIVTADEIGDVQNLNICCRVNNEVRQSSNTKYMIQPVMAAIEELSAGMTLKAGTIIATGTPGGVALGMKPPKYLKAGDLVECEIEKIGVIANVVEPYTGAAAFSAS